MPTPCLPDNRLFPAAPGQGRGKGVEVLLLLLILAAGLLVRLEDIREWQKTPDISLSGGEPLIVNLDGYYYLSLARDLLEGEYGAVDELRGVPDNPPRPWPPPPLALLAAGLASISSLSLNWIGVLVPAFLGVLLALPVYWLGKFLGNRPMGLVAALFSLISPYYAGRTNAGFFDTDCLNVFLTFLVAYLFLRFGVERSPRRYGWFGGGLLAGLFFFWWWDQAPHAVGAIVLTPLAVALAFLYRPPRREGWLFLGIVIVSAMSAGLLFGFDLPLRFYHGLSGLFSYVYDKAPRIFPNIGISITEQQVPVYTQLLAAATGSRPGYLLALAGLFMLCWKKPIQSLFLLAPLLVSLLAFWSANRFLIFLTPIMALGLGYAVSRLWEMRSRRGWPAGAIPILVPALLLAVAWPAIRREMGDTLRPIEPAPLVAGLRRIAAATPAEAVIWAWWDHGYPINYWSRRATINDGSVHGGERTVYNAIPLAADNFRLAANFMRFFTVRGMGGMRQLYEAAGHSEARGLHLAKQVLQAGPEGAGALLARADLAPVDDWQSAADWRRFFFPPDAPPIYLLVDALLLRMTWWYRFGTWDFRAGPERYLASLVFEGVRLEDGRLGNARGLDVDGESGVIAFNGLRDHLARLAVSDHDRTVIDNFAAETALSLDVFLPGEFAVLQDTLTANTVFSRLFVLHEDSGGYFAPVLLQAPIYQLWEVRGDRGGPYP